jgi:predicted dehydrogenase
MGRGFEVVAIESHRLRVAVVGVGLIGRRHMKLVSQSPHAELSAVVDPDPRALEVALAAGVPWYQTLDELLGSDPPDGAVIATPSELHVEHGLACIAANVPVLVEKPIATTVGDGLRLVEAAEAHGRPLLVGHHRRHSPFLVAASDIVRSGVLGDPVGVVATTMFVKPADYFDAGPWRRQPGGGPILINLIHDIDALRMLVGEVVAVQAMASSRVRRFPVEDTVAVALQFAGGALGSMLVSDAAASPLSWELTAGEDPAFPRQEGVDCYVIAGTRGSLGIPTMRLTTYEGDPSWTAFTRMSTVPVRQADPLKRQLEHFCAVIGGVAKPEVSGRDALETLRVTLAVEQAARTGYRVTCDPA